MNSGSIPLEAVGFPYVLSDVGNTTKLQEPLFRRVRKWLQAEWSSSDSILHIATTVVEDRALLYMARDLAIKTLESNIPLLTYCKSERSSNIDFAEVLLAQLRQLKDPKRTDVHGIAIFYDTGRGLLGNPTDEAKYKEAKASVLQIIKTQHLKVLFVSGLPLPSGEPWGAFLSQEGMGKPFLHQGGSPVVPIESLYKVLRDIRRIHLEAPPFPRSIPNHSSDIALSSSHMIKLATPDPAKLVFCDKEIRNRSSSTDEMFEKVALFYTKFIKGKRSGRNIRVAVIDTGIDPNHPIIRSLKIKRENESETEGNDGSPIKKISSFPSHLKSFDASGHGTHVTSLVMRVAPAADIYIAKITTSESVDDPGQIAEAIDWARREECDIITMSFGLTKRDELIDTAIHNAMHENILLFAAASNYGGNLGRTYPASSSKVICIHATDSLGNKFDMNPSPLLDAQNFSTIGTDLEWVWKGEKKSLSGTSYATPIAAGMAANILVFVKKQLDEGEATFAHSNEGMCKIFQHLSQKRDGYQYVVPWCFKRLEQEESLAIADFSSALHMALDM